MQKDQFIGLTLLLMTSGAAAQLPCNSQLRILLPHLFTHCECKYSDWSDWEHVPNSVATDATGNCSSGESYEEKRTRSAFGCQTEEETQSVCESHSK